jgi:hypothetical protein
MFMYIHKNLRTKSEKQDFIAREGNNTGSVCTVQRREGEAHAWEKWSTLSNLLFIQGRIELQLLG